MSVRTILRSAGHWIKGQWLKLDSELRFESTANPEIDTTGGGFLWKTITNNILSWRLRDDTTGEDIVKVDSQNKEVTIHANYKFINSDWKPNDIPLGVILTSGASFFINGGAGIYLSMSGAADDAFFFNLPLDNDGTAYDGSDLAIKIRCRLSQSGVALDTVGLLLDYAFIGNGDNSTTTVTNVAQVNTDVPTEVVDVQFDLQMTTMTGGVVGDHTLMVSVTRNSTGAGADAFGGNFEIISMELVKI
jgi:hypothetical protein